MHHFTIRTITSWCAGLLLLTMLAACGNNAPADNAEELQVKNSSTQGQENEEAQEEKQHTETRSYTTLEGETISLPAEPKRIVYTGTILGDLLALDIHVIGSNLIHTEGDWYYEDRLGGILDVGNPGDLELITSLDPDVIVDSYASPDRKEALSKISSYVPFNSSLPYYERVAELGRIFDKEAEATQWLDTFADKSAAMWDKLQIQEGETATIFLQLGKTLYVMGNRSLGVVLYSEDGFAIPEPIQTHVIDEGQTFLALSEELIHQYAGDHLFVLAIENEESQAEIDQLVVNPLWQTLPAVQAEQVYYGSAVWNSDNLLILNELLAQIPIMMGRE